jgi:hypothetical protein
VQIGESDFKVLPGDLPVELTVQEASAWGQSVAAIGGEVWAASEKEGRVLSTEGVEVSGAWAGRGIWLGELSGELLIGVSGLGLFDSSGALLAEGSESRAFASSEGQWVMAEEEGVVHSDGRSWLVEDPRSVAMSGDRIAVLSCNADQECRVVELGDEQTEKGGGEAGGALAFHQGTLWWGLPELQDPEGAGRLVSETGVEIQGRLGDHLGRSIGGGYGAGSTNGLLVPRMLRIEPLEGEGTLAVDRSSGSYTVALAGDGQNLLIGVPGWVDAGGAVMVVAVEEAP